MRQRSPGGIDARAGKNSNILVFPLTHPIVLAVVLGLILLLSFAGAVTGGIALFKASSIQSSADRAQQAAVDAAVAAERADKAERSAALSREYAVQVFPQLNRLGYPVLSPGEPIHSAAQPEDYAALDKYIEEKQK